VDHWRPETAAFAQGAKGLMRRAVTPPADFVDLYYCYYATQVVRFYGGKDGEDWKTWNEGPLGVDGKRTGGLPDVLLGLQVHTPTHRGSWNPSADRNGPGVPTFSPYCGRHGTTCMCLLTLEVYYRYTPEEAPKGEKNPMK
jgi:hypothetical protein